MSAEVQNDLHRTLWSWTPCTARIGSTPKLVGILIDLTTRKGVLKEARKAPHPRLWPGFARLEPLGRFDGDLSGTPCRMVAQPSKNRLRALD